MHETILSLIVMCLIAFMIFSIVIPYFYLRYIDRLKQKNCKCSEGFNRNFILFYSAYVYISILVVVLLSFVIPMPKINSVLRTDTKMIMSTGLSFLFALTLFKYQQKVYQTNCQCATENTKIPPLMKYHSYVVGLLVFISMLNIISILLGHGKIGKSINKSLRKSLK
jgi:hypothetical protein